MATLKLALLGAPGSGKTRLAQELAANALLPPLLIDDPSPLQGLVASLIDRPEPCADHTGLLAVTRTHLEKYDVTLLMGLDLPPPPHDATQNERMDGLLRRCLAEAGIAYQVIYGRGADRLQQALQAISRLSRPVVPIDTPGTGNTRKTDTIASRPTLFGNGEKKSAWVGMCDKCSDAECEHRSLLAQQASRLLQG